MAETNIRTSFRSFWKKSRRQDALPNEKNPSTTSNGDNSGLKVSESSRSETTSRRSLDALSNEALTASQKRRKQVYQAQKRHRNRQSDYVKNLESELARLQKRDAKVSSQKAALAHENRELRKLLSRSEDGPSDNSATLSGHAHGSNDYSALPSGTVNIRYDPDIGYQRVFVDMDDEMPDSTHTSSETSRIANPSSPVQPKAPVKGDLGSPGLHTRPRAFMPKSHPSHRASLQTQNCQSRAKSSSSTATPEQQQVQSFSSASPAHSQPTSPNNTTSPQNTSPTKAEHKWHLPHSEIDRLIELSSHLDLDDDPDHARAGLRQDLRADHLRPVLDALRKPLAREV
ncbi:hypothetical protein EJ03DRAFT_375998 [Teratosphaeria nubilosa]|uniref:BZIP domain-containing protein n=1 Tax=Teratosphaeria nubilosa TaxID=161662 RepID=A0A6G1L4D9_9PEZI|nr:hypothetical protein EJ03DRAFT_375998 [Teratosphaeria nubilosa]